MQRFLTLFSVFLLALLLVPFEAKAQKEHPPWLELNGESNNEQVLIGQGILPTSEPGSLIETYENATCSGTPVATEESPSHMYFSVPTVRSFKAFWDDELRRESDCLVGSWMGPDTSVAPPLTINGVADHAIVLIDTTVSVDTDALAEVLIYDSNDCTGTPRGTAPGGTNSHSTDPHTTSYQARWPGTTGPLSACLTATWQLPGRTDSPPLTLNGGTENVSVVGMESFTFLTDSNAEMDVYQALDCSGTPVFTQPHQWEGVSRPYNHYSVQAFWPESPELRSECLTVEILHPIPPLSVNGSTSNLSLEAGETATFLTDPLAQISMFESADCSGTPISTTTETVAERLSTDGVLSAQSNWIGDAEPVSPCLVVTWVDSTTPLPTATSEPAVTPTPEPSATQPSATVAPDPNKPDPNDAGLNNSVPNDSPASSNTQGASVVTSLPSTGSGSGSSVVIATVAVLMSVIVLAIGALRSRRA